MFRSIPQGRYHYSKMLRWKPEGRYRYRHCTVIEAFWFSTEHLWMLIAPFWLSTDDMVKAHLWFMLKLVISSSLPAALRPRPYLYSSVWFHSNSRCPQTRYMSWWRSLQSAGIQTSRRRCTVTPRLWSWYRSRYHWWVQTVGTNSGRLQKI